jgi:orotidine-5'-phosphate decarboxylase
MSETARNQLIVALDVESAAKARELFTALRDVAGMFKIGMQLFTCAGPAIVREIVDGGGRVFLDLKYHDIPNTVAAAGVEAARLGVSIFNVHAAGGSEMMRRAADAVAAACEREGRLTPKVIAVTLLTSVDAEVLAEIGVTSAPETQVARMARLAAECGLDGVVSSPLEVAAIRGAVPQEDFLIVTPGVRPSGATTHDQRRLMTPHEAIQAGSDYLVVGRPITAAADPVLAAQEILREIRAAEAPRDREAKSK